MFLKLTISMLSFFTCSSYAMQLTIKKTKMPYKEGYFVVFVPQEQAIHKPSRTLVRPTIIKGSSKTNTHDSDTTNAHIVINLTGLHKNNYTHVTPQYISPTRPLLRQDTLPVDISTKVYKGAIKKSSRQDLTANIRNLIKIKNYETQ